MNGKDRSPFLDFVVYAAIRTFALLLQLMPLSLALAIARCLAWLAYRFDRHHRLIASENLRHAFPYKSEAEIDALVRATFRHLFTMVVEYVILLRRMRPSNVQEYAPDADAENRRFAWELCQSSRPTILLTAHVGNWEVLSLSKALEQWDCTVVARRLDNPYLDRYVRRLRAIQRIRIIDKDGASGEAVSILAAGGNLAVLGDQDAGPKGLFVDFFGRPASTFKSIALLALQQNAMILVLSSLRDSRPLRHVVNLEDVIDPQDYTNNPNAVRAITQRYTWALERVVERHPEQYFWLHRRWKHQPRARLQPQARLRRAA
jgi:KDO2-lipid IV(A) lauroyltransferase